MDPAKALSKKYLTAKKFAVAYANIARALYAKCLRWWTKPAMPGIKMVVEHSLRLQALIDQAQGAFKLTETNEALLREAVTHGLKYASLYRDLLLQVAHFVSEENGQLSPDRQAFDRFALALFAGENAEEALSMPNLTSAGRELGKFCKEGPGLLYLEVLMPIFSARQNLPKKYADQCTHIHAMLKNGAVSEDIKMEYLRLVLCIFSIRIPGIASKTLTNPKNVTAFAEHVRNRDLGSHELKLHLLGFDSPQGLQNATKMFTKEKKPEAYDALYNKIRAPTSEWNPKKLQDMEHVLRRLTTDTADVLPPPAKVPANAATLQKKQAKPPGPKKSNKGHQRK
jgi:hypothetical protein